MQPQGPRRRAPMTDNLLMVAEELARDLTADIPLAKTREEHIRVTARANRATELFNLMTAEATDERI
jgi:hypothetical protein